jgi:hypothetical protein
MHDLASLYLGGAGGFDAVQPGHQQTLHPLRLGTVPLSVGIVADEVGQFLRIALQVIMG